MPYSPLANGNLDFASLLEAISAIQRNPQTTRASGTGTQSFTGSVIYAIGMEQGNVVISDSISTGYNFGVNAPGISVPGGIPFNENAVGAYGPSGGSITVTPSSSNVHWFVVYK